MPTVVFAVCRELVFWVWTVSDFTATQNKVCLGSLQSTNMVPFCEGRKKKNTSNNSRARGLLAF